MLQSSIYADLHAQDFGYSFVGRLTAMPSNIIAKVSFKRVSQWLQDVVGGSEIGGLNAHLRRDIGLDA